MRIASALARRRPMRKRSASLEARMSLFDCGTFGSATTPSAVATKFATRQGSRRPRSPP
jgi:hypothetical protein